MAILTASEALLLLPQLSAVSTGLDTMIGRAEGAIAAHLRWPPPDGWGRPNLEASTYTFYIRGPAYGDPQRVDLPLYPVVSITSIHDDPDRDYGAETLVDAADYDIDARRGQVFLRPSSTHAWNTATRTIKVVGSFGLVESDDVSDIKQAICMLVKHWWDTRHTQGKVSATQGGQSETRREDTIPKSVRQLVSRLRIWGAEIA